VNIHSCMRAPVIRSPLFICISLYHSMESLIKSPRPSESAEIILFDPPDPRRLQYLSSGFEPSVARISLSAQELAKQDGYGVGPTETTSTATTGRILTLASHTSLERLTRLNNTQLNATKDEQRALRRSSRIVRTKNPPFDPISKPSAWKVRYSAVISTLLTVYRFCLSTLDKTSLDYVLNNSQTGELTVATLFSPAHRGTQPTSYG